MVEQEPGFARKVYGTLFDVGGDPDAIKEAAEAFRALAEDLKTQLGILDRAAGAVLETWTEGKSRTAFSESNAKLKTGYVEYVAGLGEAAGTLVNTAEFIEDAQRQSRDFKIALAATVAVGVGFAIVSFGASAAAAAAEAAVITSSFWAMMARLAALLLKAVAAIARVLALSRKMIAIGLGISAASTVGFKALGSNESVFKFWTWDADKMVNPLNPDLYQAKDASNILLGGILAGGLAKGAHALKLRLAPSAGQAGISGLKAASIRLGVNGGAGIIGGGVGSSLGQYWLNNNRGKEANDAIIQTLKYAGPAGIITRLIPFRSLNTTITASPVTMTAGDWTRQLTGIPVGAKLYEVNFADTQGTEGKPETGILIIGVPPAGPRINSGG